MATSATLEGPARAIRDGGIPLGAGIVIRVVAGELLLEWPGDARARPAAGIAGGQPPRPRLPLCRLERRAYTLTPLQAQVVRVLWEADAQGTPEVGQQFLLAEVESNATRLRDLFREGGGKLAWGTLVIMARPGVYRLAPPRTA